MNGYKVHHGLPRDAKLAVIARRASLRRGEVIALWLTLLDHASQSKPRGSVKDVDSEEIAVMLDFDPACVEAAFTAFREKGMISADGRLSDWEKSQTLSSTMRTRAHRTRKRQREIPFDDDMDAAEASRRRQRLSEEMVNRHKKRGRIVTE